MNTYINQVVSNDPNNEDGFIPVQKKSRFNALSENAKSKQSSQPTQSLQSSHQSPNISSAVNDSTSKRILFKRKESNPNASPLVSSVLNAPPKKMENINRDPVPITMQVLSPKKLMVVKKKEPLVNINSFQLFPDLKEKPTITVKKTSTVWNTFKTSQLDVTKIPTFPPVIVMPVSQSNKPSVKKVISSSSSDDEQSYEEYYDENYDNENSEDYDDYEETLLETLYYKQNNILEQLEELEQNGKMNTYKYRKLEIDLAEVNHDIHLEEYYEQQIDNEMYERLNQVLLGNYYPSFSHDNNEVLNEKNKENEMRERKARIDIIGYDDYDQFQLKLEDDLKKLRKYGLTARV